MRILSHLFILFIICLLLGACYADPDCIGLRNNILGVSFKQKSNNESSPVKIIGIMISNADSVFNAGDSTAQVYLPLNVNDTRQTLSFNLSTGTFSMIVDYTSKPQFESVDCGPRFSISNLKVAEHSFDSVYVSGSIPLSGLSGTNIIVYAD